MSHFQYVERPECICGAALAAAAARTLERAFAWGPVRFVRCAACGSWCQSPRITPESIAGWYGSEAYLGSRRRQGVAYADYFADEAARRAEAAHRVRADLAPLLPSGAAVLEVGCATGSLVSALCAAGHRARGLDLSPALVERGRSDGLELEVGDVLHARYPAASFDAVLLFGTISNLQGLAARLERIHAWLKPGGALVFNFVDAGSWPARLYGARLWMFSPSVDVFMTRRGCELALGRSGFGRLRVAVDWQRPSWQKILAHANLRFLAALAARAGLAARALPFAIPVPLARFCVARKG